MMIQIPKFIITQFLFQKYNNNLNIQSNVNASFYVCLYSFVYIHSAFFYLAQLLTLDTYFRRGKKDLVSLEP